MSETGKRLIAAAKEAAGIAKAENDRETDRLMLKSMATALRADMEFSFNRFDMADLLDRAAEKFGGDTP